MSTSNENDYTFVEPTTALQNLAQIAGDETREEAVAAKQTPVSKLTYTAGCKEITAEYYRNDRIPPLRRSSTMKGSRIITSRKSSH